MKEFNESIQIILHVQDFHVQVFLIFRYIWVVLEPWTKQWFGQKPKTKSICQQMDPPPVALGASALELCVWFFVESVKIAFFSLLQPLSSYNDKGA